ncbi:UDP-N-acetylmuramoyl-tripeptide--D-alanyl-D-alanine ligase [Naumannella halotolerans]|uniref:UDP-N-acetylmuramoyl-tripeptide--D-alanyl-D-alanine ligase n=1 Tax=Naumannella halotolerans TaxID=993414 RepID=A0A4R7J8F5_9ACTN|nr:UDP-N-acetylmuramoyl-tripeptide--D-alanyl-D-alanine ligase [Naumannella halotolerans]TDT32807.1 UDP-N-acetylmuramoyl-tripeptide--D-alanyl-D-alanine ligase [Naumannella halotolerans]
MRILRLAEIAAAVDGRVIGDPELPVGPQVSIDSRRLTAGALFVAVAGERVDGHDYAADAIGSGAAAVLTERPIGDLPQVVVADTVVALGALGRYVLDHSEAEVVALTGSQGKTSTKDLLAQLLEASGPTVAPVGSYNNEYGLPLTATGVEPDTRWLVAEMGARGIGHIAHLCALTPPTVGAVLNVGHAHIGEFGDQETIARAKGELVEALPADGWAVLNATDPRVAAMAERTSAHLAWWAVGGRPRQAGELFVWSTEESVDALDRYSFTLNVADVAGVGDGHRVRLQQSGRHQIGNALAAAACAVAVLGTEAAERIAGQLSAAGARSAWRMELTRLRPPGGGPGEVLLINDAYNANPDSMQAALNSLANIARQRSGRAIAVVGDMLELGPASRAEHEAVGRAAGALNLDLLLGVGEYSAATVDAARTAGVPQVRTMAAQTDQDRRDVAAQIEADLRAGDVVLVKASRAQQLEVVAAALVESLGAVPETEEVSER